MNSAIPTLKAMAISACFLLTPAFLPLAMTSCERDDSVKEKVDDALDRRPGEAVKDAAEDAKDAIEDAADETKDAVKDATN